VDVEILSNAQSTSIDHALQRRNYRYDLLVQISGPNSAHFIHVKKRRTWLMNVLNCLLILCCCLLRR